MDDEPPPLLDREPYEFEEDTFVVQQLKVASIKTDWNDIDSLLDKMSYEQLTKQEEFHPEDHGYPELELEDHEREVLFHPPQ